MDKLIDSKSDRITMSGTTTIEKSIKINLSLPNLKDIFIDL